MEACPPFRMRLPMDGGHGARAPLPTLPPEYAKAYPRHCELREAIHTRRAEERMDCFVAFAPRNDGEHSFAISPQVCARFIVNFRLLKIRGRRESRVPTAPAVRVQQKSTRQNHRYRRIIRPSLRNGFTAYT